MRQTVGFAIYLNSCFLTLGSTMAALMSYPEGWGWSGIVLGLIGVNVGWFGAWGGLRMTCGDPFRMWKEVEEKNVQLINKENK